MAHELDTVETATGVQARMFYAGDVPWHGLGQRLDGVATWEQAVAAAHLDFEIVKEPLYYRVEDPQSFGKFQDAFGYYGLMNGDSVRQSANGKPASVFGVVSAGYKVVQNVDLFKFFNPIVAENEAMFHTAGALFGGMKVWCLAKLPTSLVVADKDVIDQYVLLSNTHDGTSSLRIQYTPVRVVCNNTLSCAESNASHVISLRHSQNVLDQLEEAHKLMGIIGSSDSKIAQTYNRLAARSLTTTGARRYFHSVFPREPDTSGTSKELVEARTLAYNAKLDSLMQRFEYGPGHQEEGIRGSVWAAYNAVTHYIDHRSARYRGNKAESRMNYILFGEGARTKQRALELADQPV